MKRILALLILLPIFGFSQCNLSLGKVKFKYKTSTAGWLPDYLIGEVSLQSLKENKKEQDPSVNASQEVSTQWRNWKF